MSDPQKELQDSEQFQSMPERPETGFWHHPTLSAISELFLRNKVGSR